MITNQLRNCPKKGEPTIWDSKRYADRHIDKANLEGRTVRKQSNSGRVVPDSISQLERTDRRKLSDNIQVDQNLIIDSGFTPPDS